MEGWGWEDRKNNGYQSKEVYKEVYLTPPTIRILKVSKRPMCHTVELGHPICTNRINASEPGRICINCIKISTVRQHRVLRTDSPPIPDDQKMLLFQLLLQPCRRAAAHCSVRHKTVCNLQPSITILSSELK